MRRAVVTILLAGCLFGSTRAQAYSMLAWLDTGWCSDCPIGGYYYHAIKHIA